MALKVGDKIITASAAAGPAIEGQGISSGMLPSPGAICDVKAQGQYWKIIVLDKEMEEREAYLIHPVTGKIKGITDMKRGNYRNRCNLSSCPGL
jgi:methylamine methyltransferase corrinoid activation protein